MDFWKLASVNWLSSSSNWLMSFATEFALFSVLSLIFTSGSTTDTSITRKKSINHGLVYQRKILVCKNVWLLTSLYTRRKIWYHAKIAIDFDLFRDISANFRTETSVLETLWQTQNVFLVNWLEIAVVLFNWQSQNWLRKAPQNNNQGNSWCVPHFSFCWFQQNKGDIATVFLCRYE